MTPVLCEHCGELRDEQAIRAALAGMQVGDLVSPSCVHARVDIAALLAALDAERARAERAESLAHENFNACLAARSQSLREAADRVPADLPASEVAEWLRALAGEAGR